MTEKKLTTTFRNYNSGDIIYYTDQDKPTIVRQGIFVGLEEKPIEHPSLSKVYIKNHKDKDDFIFTHDVIDKEKAIALEEREKNKEVKKVAAKKKRIETLKKTVAKKKASKIKEKSLEFFSVATEIPTRVTMKYIQTVLSPYCKIEKSDYVKWFNVTTEQGEFCFEWKYTLKDLAEELRNLGYDNFASIYFLKR